MSTDKVATHNENACPWETGELGTSIDHAIPAEPEHEAALSDSLGLQMISIRLPKNLIEDLKYFAEREGLGYQPLVRRILMRWTSHEYKLIAQERFATSMATPAALDTEPSDVDVEPRKAVAR